MHVQITVKVDITYPNGIRNRLLEQTQRRRCAAPGPPLPRAGLRPWEAPPGAPAPSKLAAPLI